MFQKLVYFVLIYKNIKKSLSTKTSKKKQDPHLIQCKFIGLTKNKSHKENLYSKRECLTSTKVTSHKTSKLLSCFPCSVHKGDVLKPLVIGFHELNVMIRLVPTLACRFPEYRPMTGSLSRRRNLLGRIMSSSLYSSCLSFLARTTLAKISSLMFSPSSTM